MLSIKQRLHLVAISIGLFCCYAIFGILQERIFRKGYGSTDEAAGEQQFTFSVTFVCLQCIFYSLFAKGKFRWTWNFVVISLIITRAAILLTHDHSSNETHQGFYASTAVFYVVGLVTSNSALQFISYPSQVVGKGLIMEREVGGGGEFVSDEWKWFWNVVTNDSLPNI